MGVFRLLAICLLVVSCQESFKIEGGALSSGTNSFPPHAVVPFSTATCPTGWTPYVKGRGRVLLGAGAGNLDVDSLALSIRFFDSIGGREYTTALPGFSDAADEATPAPELVFGIPSTITPYRGSFNNYSTGFLDSNMPPFIVKLYCEKMGTDESLVASHDMIIAFESSSCSGDWASDSETAGRFIVGSGLGVADPDGQALTLRVLNATGGIPHTPAGFRFTTLSGNTRNPDGGYFATQATYYAATANTTIYGAKTDSNLPPYVVVNYCSNVSSGFPSLPSNVVLAFNTSSCPTGWVSFDEAQGRALLGAGGMGNLDREGLPLAPRFLGVTGGREYTTGVPASTNTGTLSAPGVPTTGSTNIYSSSPPDSFLSGSNTDANLPPYVALKFCRKL